MKGGRINDTTMFKKDIGNHHFIIIQQYMGCSLVKDKELTEIIYDTVIALTCLPGFEGETLLLKTLCF